MTPTAEPVQSNNEISEETTSKPEEPVQPITQSKFRKLKICRVCETENLSNREICNKCGASLIVEETPSYQQSNKTTITTNDISNQKSGMNVERSLAKYGKIMSVGRFLETVAWIVIVIVQISQGVFSENPFTIIWNIIAAIVTVILAIRLITYSNAEYFLEKEYRNALGANVGYAVIGIIWYGIQAVLTEFYILIPLAVMELIILIVGIMAYVLMFRNSDNANKPFTFKNIPMIWKVVGGIASVMVLILGIVFVVNIIGSLDDDPNLTPASEFEYEINGNNVTIKKYIGERHNVVIPEKIKGKIITEIDRFAFYKSTMISVKIPDSVTIIGNYAFSDCEFLRIVTIPGSVRIISQGTFLNCKSLVDVTILEGVKSIEEAAFTDCPLERIIIPDSVISIDDRAFVRCPLSKDSKERILQINPNAIF